MIKYIEDLFYSIEYHFLRVFCSPYKKFEVDEATTKAVQYCLRHHIKYDMRKIRNRDKKTHFVVFSYVQPEDGEIQTHVVWCESDENNC